MELISRDGAKTLSRDGEEYVMAGGRYGEHRLFVAYTDAKRLKAHWLGYCAEDATEAELTRTYFDASDARTKRMIVECDHETAQEIESGVDTITGTR